MQITYKEKLKKHRKNSKKWNLVYVEGCLEMLSKMPIENIYYLEKPLHSAKAEEDFYHGIQFQMGNHNFTYYSEGGTGEIWQENEKLTIPEFAKQMQILIQSDPKRYDEITIQQINQKGEELVMNQLCKFLQAEFKLALTNWLRQNIQIEKTKLKKNTEEETEIYFEFQGEPAILVRDLNEGEFSEANVYNLQGEDAYLELYEKIEKKEQFVSEKSNFPSFDLKKSHNVFSIMLFSDVLDVLVVEKFKKTKAYKLAKVFQGPIPAMETVG